MLNARGGKVIDEQLVASIIHDTNVVSSCCLRVNKHQGLAAIVLAVSNDIGMQTPKDEQSGTLVACPVLRGAALPLNVLFEVFSLKVFSPIERLTGEHDPLPAQRIHRSCAIVVVIHHADCGVDWHEVESFSKWTFFEGYK